MRAAATQQKRASNLRYGGAFYTHGTVELARKLLGAKLVTAHRGVVTSGMIVEVEAYLGVDDPACHAARGKTARNEVMFRSPGHCYVYLIYGMYHCVNVVSDPEGIGSAVLIRAVEPLDGIDAMRRRRGSRTLQVQDVARGPGRLCDALGITTQLSGLHLANSTRIWIERYCSFSDEDVGMSGRVGISKGTDLQLRFFLKGSPWVSRPGRVS